MRYATGTSILVTWTSPRPAAHELFRTDRDPWCERNVYGDASAHLKRSLDAEVDAWRACRGAACRSTAVPRGRSKLLCHVPKCGGTYVREALKRLVPEASLVIKREFASSDERDQRGHFVVASVRDPCSYYASLSEYGTQNEGAFRHQLERVRPDLADTYAVDGSFEEVARVRKRILFKTRLRVPARSGGGLLGAHEPHGCGPRALSAAVPERRWRFIRSGGRDPR